jgi:hypothetical protein
LSCSTDKGERLEGTEGGPETKNRRELRALNIYFLAWAAIFVAVVMWKIVVPIIGLALGFVYSKFRQYTA